MPDDDAPKRLGIETVPCPEHLKLGASRDLFDGGRPLNGLRLPPEEGTCGWFLWTGESFSTDPDFFRPMHARHVIERLPEVAPYLELPPGYRFLLAPGYEDVWFDPSLLDPPGRNDARRIDP